MAEHLYTYDDPPSERHLNRTVALLERGGRIAYPTDTNWAIGCDASQPKALEQLFRLKPDRPKDQPFSLVCADIAMVAEYAIVDQPAYRAMRKALPGPYTILLLRSRNLPRQLKDKRKVVGVRIPRCPLLLALVERLGRPLATTSCPPLSEGPPPEEPTMGYQVVEAFGHALDLVLDLGDELQPQPSTIIDYTEGVAHVVRQGAGDPTPFL